MHHDEIVRLYGAWMSHTPGDAAELLRGYPGAWWIAGGWAIERFTGLSRPHGDIDLSIPRTDTDLLREHLTERLDIWCADRGTLRPLLPGTSVPSTCSNLWLRHDGSAPWEYDVILMDISKSRWTYKRDSRISRAFTDILWQRGQVHYLRPEVQLLYKAPGLRSQDQEDFDASVPLLDSSARRWLHTSLQSAHPGHPWVEALR